MNIPARLALPIPLGWYCIGQTEELAVAEVKPVRYFGEELVLYRSLQGEVCLAQAYCPHLGAHLGHGGSVDEAGINCPFHGWKFDVEGRIAEIPYAERIPAKLQGKVCLKTYPIIEKSGFIWAWYHPLGEPPTFAIESFGELDEDGWKLFGSHQWTINTHVQETGENAVDTAHFLTVHGCGDVMADSEMVFDRHRRDTQLILDFKKLNSSNSDASEEFISGRIVTTNVGPGQTWTRQYGFVDLMIIGLPTPVDAETLELRIICAVPNDQAKSHAKIAQMLYQDVVAQINQDIPIWEHKVYRAEPMLCDGDGPISKYRKWFGQFYV